MKFSVSLPRPEDNVSANGIDGFVALAQAVERVGLHAVSASDHPFPLVAGGRAGHQTYDPFVLLSFIGSATQRISLHFSLLVAPYRNPFLTARMLGTLDIASGGRVIVGLGAGYLKTEFEALGADFENRSRNVDNVVNAMRAAWSGKAVHLSGPNWSADGNVMLPVPTSTPYPRLWRGGNSTKAIERAVTLFDGWAPFEVNTDGSKQTTTIAMSLETLGPRVAQLRELLVATHRTTPFDLCYVRTSRRWLKDRGTMIEHLQEFNALGVTWLEFNVSGTSPGEWIDSAEAFASAAREAGVL